MNRVTKPRPDGQMSLQEDVNEQGDEDYFGDRDSDILDLALFLKFRYPVF